MESSGPTINSSVNRRQSQELRQEKRPLQSGAKQQQPQQPQRAHQPIGNNAVSRIPTFSADRRQRPRPATKHASSLPSWTLTETPGDRLLSSLRALEDEIQDDHDQSSASNASSAIWHSAAPIVADREVVERVSRTHTVTNVVVHSAATPDMSRLDMDDESMDD